MRRLLLIAAIVFLCQSAFGQNKFVYNGKGDLNYIVSDTLRSKLPIGDYFNESLHTSVGSYVGYKTTKSFINIGDDWRHVATNCEPYVFGVSISKQSLRSLRTWLCYVKENHLIGDPTTKYSFTDESRELVIVILKPNGYNVWMLRVDDMELKIDFLDRLIPSLEELEGIVESKHTEWNL